MQPCPNEPRTVVVMNTEDFRMSTVAPTLAATFAMVVAGLLAGACKDPGGCSNDNDCKGARVCERGTCVEAKPGATTQPPAASTPATPTIQATANVPHGPSDPPGTPTAACVPCSTQEDFDRALRGGNKCCPVTACRADADCTAGRVCCRIPGGQLCADTGRCKPVNRVAAPNPGNGQGREAHCRSVCPHEDTRPGEPGVEITHCYCVCMGQCPPDNF